MSLTLAQKNQLMSTSLQHAQDAINADKRGNYYTALRNYISAAECMNKLRKGIGRHSVSCGASSGAVPRAPRNPRFQNVGIPHACRDNQRAHRTTEKRGYCPAKSAAATKCWGVNGSINSSASVPSAKEPLFRKASSACPEQCTANDTAVCIR